MSRTPPPTVLIVDDFADARALLRTLLEARGYHTVEASDGQEAIALARDVRPRVVLLDLGLPVLSGWEVARVLREDPATSHACIVACTAYSRPSELEHAREAGCAHVLTKPIDFDALLELLASIA
ncbi:response regulator [Sandaracinus amylolyticus]|uniref:Chemotaxis protein methyltransferase CheR n=1 Tax=Sandaracinus amylolyticus TaxID=927083 RepID=A0A0F6YH96_9BACT|nr:response regulator [Sandaracinus amylolyticus]AKF04510.1 Chemotaxis protein methyltransferase CheR [Sandaracinus amylolyticus]